MASCTNLCLWPGVVIGIILLCGRQESMRGVACVPIEQTLGSSKSPLRGMCSKHSLTSALPMMCKDGFRYYTCAYILD